MGGNFGFSEMFHLSNKNIVFARQQLFHSTPRALSLGWIAFQYFGVSDIALYSSLLYVFLLLCSPTECDRSTGSQVDKAVIFTMYPIFFSNFVINLIKSDKIR
jgi:hypothetical protein